MSNFPYDEAVESYPDSREHTRYQRIFNTRTEPRDRPPLYRPLGFWLQHWQQRRLLLDRWLQLLPGSWSD